MTEPVKTNRRLAENLVLDELFDLTLYKALHAISADDLRSLLEELIVIETKHVAFWQEFFDTKVNKLNLGRRFKLRVIVGLCRVFGTKAIHLTLEAIEIYGLRKYLSIWKAYKDTALGEAVKEVLDDEFKHEDQIVSRLVERQINPERIRSVFLGFNDGLVEILGAVSGFFAAFQDAASVLIAGSTVAVAGSLSMAAGAFAASSSEKEVIKMEKGKAAFLGVFPETARVEEAPLSSSVIVGVSYMVGAVVPVLPVLFGSRSPLVSVLAAGSMIIVVSFVLAFLSGMDIKKRILTNLVIIAAAVGITYTIGMIARSLWGIAL